MKSIASNVKNYNTYLVKFCNQLDCCILQSKAHYTRTWNASTINNAPQYALYTRAVQYNFSKL